MGEKSTSTFDMLFIYLLLASEFKELIFISIFSENAVVSKVMKKKKKMYQNLFFKLTEHHTTSKHKYWYKLLKVTILFFIFEINTE